MRTGDTAFSHVVGLPFFEHRAANAEAEAVFNEAMASATEGAARAVADAYDFSRCRTIVDLGGTGAFLAGILQANPQARGVLFDGPNVVAAAEGLLTNVGLGSRCDVVAGDFFEAVPDGGDVYILSWIIHGTGARLPPLSDGRIPEARGPPIRCEPGLSRFALLVTP